MGIYKPSNLSPNFEELIVDENSNILGESFNISFQVNTKYSTIKSYRIAFYKANELTQEDSIFNVGNIYGVLDREYKNGESCIINISKEMLDSDNITLETGENYKWQLRLYEDIIQIPKNQVDYEIKKDENNQKIPYINGAATSATDSFETYGIYSGEISIPSIKQTLEGGIKNNISNKVLISNYNRSVNTPIRIESDIEECSIQPFENDFHKDYIYEVNNTQSTLNLSVLYPMGNEPVSGLTYIGEGSLAGSTKDEIWIKNISGKISQDDYIEIQFKSEDTIISDDQTKDISASNTNNSDFVPFQYTENSSSFSSKNLDDKILINNVNQTLGQAKVLGWGGKEALGLKWEPASILDTSPNRTTVSIKIPRGDMMDLVEKWYLQADFLNDEIIEYLKDGNCWVKFSMYTLPRGQYDVLGDSIFENKKDILTKNLNFSEYKNIISAGVDQHGFYIGINAAEGILSQFRKLPRDEYINLKSGEKYNTEATFLAYNLYQSIYSPLFTGQALKIVHINASFIYKQREKIDIIENNVSNTNLTYIKLQKDMNFNKLQFGDKDYGKAVNAKDFNSVCCVNKVNNDFTVNQIYIAPRLQDIGSGSSYINLYYFDEDKLDLYKDENSEKLEDAEYTYKDLPDTCHLIDNYEFYTGKLNFDREFSRKINTGWRYQILTVCKKHTVSETEIEDIFRVSAYGILGDKQVYIRSHFNQEINDYFAIKNKDQYETICTNSSPFDVGIKHSSAKEEDILSDDRIRLFINPNSQIKLDDYKPMMLELFNGKETLKLFLDEANIDTLNNTQTLITLRYDIYDYYNNIKKSKPLDLITQINKYVTKDNFLLEYYGIYDARALYNFMRPGTKFKIYSNFVDSDNEGYICVRPNKKIDIYYDQINGDKTKIETDSTIECRNLNLTCSVYDCNSQIEHRNNSKITWYQFKVSMNSWIDDQGNIHEDNTQYVSDKIFDSNFRYSVDLIKNVQGDQNLDIEVLICDEFGRTYLDKRKNITINSPSLSFPYITNDRDYMYDDEKQAIKISVLKGIYANTKSYSHLSDESYVNIKIYKSRNSMNEVMNDDFRQFANFKIKRKDLNKTLYDYDIINGEKIKYKIFVSFENLEPIAWVNSNIFACYHSYSGQICVRSKKYIVCDLRYDLDNDMYFITQQFNFSGNIEIDPLKDLNSIRTFNPMANYPKYALGINKTRQGGFKSLLGNMKEIKKYDEELQTLNLTKYPGGQQIQVKINNETGYQYHESIQKYEEWRKMISNGNLKYIKYPNGEKYIVAISDSIESTFDNRARRIPTMVKFQWIEMDDAKIKPVLSLEE